MTQTQPRKNKPREVTLVYPGELQGTQVLTVEKVRMNPLGLILEAVPKMFVSMIPG